MTKTVSEKTLALIPGIIQAQGINVPIYRIEETKTLVRLYLYGRSEPITVRKPPAKGGKAAPAKRKATR